jgi:heme exporter protein C
MNGRRWFDVILLVVLTAWVGWLTFGGLGYTVPVPSPASGAPLQFTWVEFGVPPAQPAAGGWAQKIFYLHVPSATIGFLGFLLVAGVSLAVLLGETEFWDRFVPPFVEVSFLLATVVIFSGPFWAKPVWGIWWRWEPRMTTFFVLWLMYGGWFLLRGTLPPGRQRSTYSAIYALLAFLNVPVVMLSVYFWKPEQQLHPRDISLEPIMHYTLYASFIVILLVFLRLVWLRVSYENLKRELEAT